MAVDYKQLRDMFDEGNMYGLMTSLASSSRIQMGTSQSAYEKAVEGLKLEDVTKYVSPDIDSTAIKDMLLAAYKAPTVEKGKSTNYTPSISELQKMYGDIGISTQSLRGMSAAALQETKRLDLQAIEGLKGDHKAVRTELSTQISDILGFMTEERLGTALTGDARFDINAEGQTLKNLVTDITSLQKSLGSTDYGLESLRLSLRAVSLDKTVGSGVQSLLKGKEEGGTKFASKIFRELDIRSPLSQVTEGSPVRRRNERPPLGLLSKTDSELGVSGTLGTSLIFGV